MRLSLRTVVMLSASLLLIGMLSSSGLADEKGHMGRMGMMQHVDKMMGQCEKMRESTDMMMGRRMSKSCMGMMNMQNMGMMMHNMSQDMKGMLESMDSMMQNNEMMKDPEVKKHAEQMEEHMRSMTESMQKAMDSMQKMTERMQETEE